MTERLDLWEGLPPDQLVGQLNLLAVQLLDLPARVSLAGSGVDLEVNGGGGVAAI